MSPRSKAQFQEVREQSKNKILDASLELFALEGYEATSIAKIAEKAQISKGLMYNYFHSKEDLLKGLVNRLQEGEEHMMKDVFDEDPKVMLRKLFEIFFDEMRNNFQQWVFISKLTMQMDRFEFIKELAMSKYQGYVKLFEQLLDSAGIPNADHEAKILVAIFDGIGFQYMILKEQYPLDELQEFLIEKYCQ